jgi:hypothetical protein
MATKRKVRRFAEGEFIDTESESGEWAGDENYGDGTTREERVAMAKSPSYKPKEAADESAMETNVGQGKSSGPAKKSFKDAFSEARKGGGKSFEWEGKKYSTDMAGEKKAAPKAEQASARRVDNDIAARASRNTRTGAGAGEAAAYAASKMGGSGRGGQGGPTADELDAYAKSKKKPDIKGLMPSDENMQKGLEIAAGAPGLKAVASAAKSMANRAPAAAEKLREYIQPTLAAPTKRLTGPAAKEAATDAAPKMLPAPAKSAPAKESSAAREARRSEEGYSPEEALKKLGKGEVSSKGREEVTNPLSWMAGPKNSGKFKESAKRDKKDTDASDVDFKKGGNVRGWGIARGARKAKIV